MELSSDLLNATVYLVSASHGTYGDYDETTSGDGYACRFREISRVDSNDNEETRSSDAMLWVDSGSGIREQSIVRVVHDSTERFRVTRVTRARGASSSIAFLKCELERYHD